MDALIENNEGIEYAIAYVEGAAWASAAVEDSHHKVNSVLSHSQEYILLAKSYDPAADGHTQGSYWGM